MNPTDTPPAAGDRPDRARVDLACGTTLELGPLTAWDSIRYRERFGHPIESMDQDGSPGVLWLAWRSALNAGYGNGTDTDAAFEEFCRLIRLDRDVPALTAAVVRFFVQPQA